eukprot:2106649-Prymnesium_polylepis.1
MKFPGFQRLEAPQRVSTLAYGVFGCGVRAAAPGGADRHAAHRARAASKSRSCSRPRAAQQGPTEAGTTQTGDART